MPYISLYLKTSGFEAQDIGELIAIISATKIIAPNILGWIADKTGRHIVLVRVTSFLTVLCFSGLFLGDSYLWLALIFGAFSFFWNASLPQFEAVTIAHLGKQVHRYSQIRLWGSIGFIIMVMSLGWLFNFISITFLPILLIGLFSGIFLSGLLVPEKDTRLLSVDNDSFYQIIKRPSVIVLFLISFLIQASHGPYYTFYSIYLEDYGYNRNLIGQLWALGVIAEVMVFLVMHRLLKNFNLKYLLIISLVLTSIRWLLIGYYMEYLPILLFAQLLHAASFGMYHGISMQFISQTFAHCHQGKAQALYSAFGFGAGGVVGSLLSGYTWENFGAIFSYSWAAILCIMASWISWRWLKINNNKLI
jgi:PPP family 3-phenylpropionic acid transporter